jgi:hypothetical protein
VELQEQEKSQGAQRGVELGSEGAGDVDGTGAGVSGGILIKFEDIPSTAEGMPQGVQ